MTRVQINPGDRYNRLVVIKELEPDKKRYHGNTLRHRKFECRCDCGKITVKWMGGLRSGNVKSCGCWLREKAKQTAEKYFRKPPGESQFNDLIRRYEVSAKKRNLVWGLTAPQFQALVEHNCVFCGRTPHNLMKRRDDHYYCDYFYTGVDRLDPAKGYIPGNCVPCCKICNYAKQTMALNQFLEWVVKVHKQTKSMSTNDYIDLATKLTGVTPEKTAVSDHSAQVDLGLEMAKRQAERPVVIEPKIPALGAMPLAN